MVAVVLLLLRKKKKSTKTPQRAAYEVKAHEMEPSTSGVDLQHKHDHRTAETNREGVGGRDYRGMQ